MKKLKKIFILFISLIFILILLMNQKVFANIDSINKMEYSEDFKRWLELSDEEKENTIQPRMYDLQPTTFASKNPLYKIRLLGASINKTYSLKNVIPSNLIIRDQMSTNSCWAFAALSTLETNLALANYKKTNTDLNSKVYDFSERHMEYATSKTFKDGVQNKIGYNREVGSGGNWTLVQSYLTNGSGAIDESDMPFENNETQIEISKIQNKAVTSQVYDTVEFADYNKNASQKSEIMQQIKQHIQNYGSVFASIHGNSSSTTEFSCYNNDTGAKYCNNDISHTLDHAVSIIGWDDDYSINKFAKDAKPTTNGAWIVRNSWGERQEYDLLELKTEALKQFQEKGTAGNYTRPEQIPDEVIKRAGFTIEGDKAYIKIGDNGIMYVSYEDCNISKTLYGIVKATDTLNYENIYQYDEYYPISVIALNNNNKATICNIFDKKTEETEYLTQVSIYAPETYICKVYVNPNGEGKNKEDLQLVNLKAGTSETFNSGYHTLEFAEPIEIKANKFAVAIEIQGTQVNSLAISLETKFDEIPMYNCVETVTQKCFISSENASQNYNWEDVGNLYNLSSGRLPNGDTTIKAFTTSNLNDESLKSIEIVTPPNKTKYFEGEDFDKTGMVVKANYNSNTKPSEVLDNSSYSITNGTNLVEGQESVTITYQGKTATQPITVEKNTVTNLSIETPPTKLQYFEGENFDTVGMVIKATYKNGTTKIITDYTISDGNNLEANQTEVTISYEGLVVKQNITVIANPLLEINITKASNKVNYVVGQDFDNTGMIVTGTYQNGVSQEILNYIVENGTNLTKEQTSVTIKYKDKTAVQPITVVEKSITEISVDKNPTKLAYIKDKENLDLNGGTLKIIYNDGTTESIDMTSSEVSVSGFSNESIGTITITVTYQNKTAQFEVQIIEEEKAENSNLNNITSNVKKIKAYYFTNNSQKDYISINVEINNISRNTNNDSLEYYYYLSSNADEQNINNWVKITENQNDNSKLQFTINSKDISNYNEISDEGTLYLYIKEVAIKGGNQSVIVSKPMKLETDLEVETYVDNVRKDNLDNNEPSKDGTTAPGTIPNTGTSIIIIISLVLMIVLCIAIYVKYNKFKDIK